MGAARRQLSRIEDLEFWKLCGSGIGEGFTPAFTSGVFAILCVWPREQSARKKIGNEELFERYRSHASESWTIFLTPISVRGAWSGSTPFAVSSKPSSGPLAVLTRATLRPRNVLGFWKYEPAISDVIGTDPNVVFKIGIGEIPYFQQVTFSVWPNVESMAAFARKPDGPHARAICAVRRGDWFREELYARFRILGDSGSWCGTSPISSLDL